MGAAIRAFNWSATPLGPIDEWPQSLLTSAGICLNSRFPILVWWGRDLTMLYNDAYREILASKHPAALGRAGRQVWPEIWDVIGPMLNGVLRDGTATRSDDLLLKLERNGYPEECYFTFSYSPIFDEYGEIAGVFTPVAETTEKVVGERRLRTLRDLASRGAEARSANDALRLAAECLAQNPYDLPFALLYSMNGGGPARLAGTAGIESGGPGAPQLAEDGDASGWPLALVAGTGAAVVVDDLEERFGALPTGAWNVPPRCAMLLPVVVSGRDHAAAVLVAAVNPHRALDDQYRSFLELAARQISSALNDALSYEEERRRAEALAELDRAKSAFFSNVSHEFRTPLTLLLGPAEEALGGRAEPREALELAHRNGLRMLKLVNALLDFSRLEAGRMQASFAAVDLAEATAETASAFRPLIEGAGLRYTVDCPPLSRAVAVDREMWEKILLNLISNAFKFTFEGEIAVSLRGGAEGVELAVRDTGTGVPASEQGRIFQRFHRVEGARGRSWEGSGIGLALVDELVKLHGGSIAVASEEGRGSTFTVKIPWRGGAARNLAESGEPAPAAASRPMRQAFLEEAARWVGTGAVPGREDPTAGARPRVLLADDNADMRDYLVRLLGTEYEVEAAADGAAALERARAAPPALVLADVMMPGLDGFELLRALRANPPTAATPVILLSARAGEEARVEGLDAGADDYLVKPFTARELLARVRAHLRMAEVRRRAEAEHTSTMDLLEQINEAFFSFDAEGRLAYSNGRAAELAGSGAPTMEEIFGEAFAARLRQVAAENQPAHFEEQHRGRWVGVRAYPAGGGVSVLLLDVTARKNVEREQARQFAQLEAIYATAAAVTRAGALDGIYAEALNGLRRALGLDRLSVLTCDKDGVMRFRGWRGLSDWYRATVEGHSPWRQGQKDAAPLLVPDVELDAELAPYREVFARENIRALAFIPLMGGSGVLGKFMLYYAAPHEFTPGEIHVAETIASHVAFATERKIAEDELAQAKARLQDILDSITEWFVALDREWRFTYASRRVVEAAGAKNFGEIAGRSVWELFPQAVESEFYPQYQRVVTEGVPVHFEVLLSGRWLDVYAHPTQEGLSAYVLDISDRKTTDDELRRSEQQHRFLAEGMPQIVWTGDTDGRTVFLNRHWREYTGLPDTPEGSQQWPAVVHPDDVRHLASVWETHRAEGQPFELECRLRRASDGFYRWHYACCQPVRSTNGRVAGWVGTALDIDDRKRAEEKSRKSEERAQRQLLELQNLYETAPIGLCFVDTALRFLRINGKLADLHGLPAAAHIGKTLHDVAPYLAPVLEPMYARVIETGEPINQVEVEVNPPSGEKRSWLVSMIPLEWEGELIGINKVVHDITERKQFEAQLRQTQKLEAIGILAGGVAHDFNNLLTGILGNASLAMEMCAERSPLRPILDELVRASERAADLTRQLLAYSGRGRFVIEPVNLSMIVNDIASLLRTSIPKKVKVILDFDWHVPSIEADATQIRQLIMNLVINAAEAIPAERSGLVRIRTGVTNGPVRDTVGGHELPAGHYVYLEVEDNGTGMDAATRAKIFDPFFTTKFTGRGLGLAAALGIVRGHRGAIELASDPGLGSRFVVHFPAIAVVAHETPAIAPPAKKAAGLTVLVVDDEEVVRGTARAVLDRFGYRVLLAEDGAEALELFAKEAAGIDAVLLDVSMPGMSGLETLEQLRRFRPDIKVIVSSGYDEHETMRRFESHRVDAYLQKPYRGARLEHVLREVLSRPAGGGPPS